MTFHSSYSHFSKNRLLVSCLSLIIGGPLMCCCLLGLFYVVFPVLEEPTSGNLSWLLILGGLAIFSLLSAVALAAMFQWYRKSRGQNLS